MGALVTNYCRHSEDIDAYISSIHPKKGLFDSYRQSWNQLEGGLRFVLLETTSKCNLKCDMCIQSVGYDDVQDMDNALFEAACENIQKYSIPSVCVNQTNEALLDKEIINKIKRIAALDSVVDVMMNTNGVLLNKKTAEGIIQSGLHRLLVGFDAANANTYKLVRGASFDKVKRNIMQFLLLREKMGKKFPVLRLSFVRTSQNANEVDEWVGYWKDIADYITVQEFITPVLDASKDHLYPIDAYRASEAAVASPACYQPFKQVTIRGNGDVIPCCSHLAVKMPMGNLLENRDLMNIFSNERSNRLRSSLMDGSYLKNNICRACLGGIEEDVGNVIRVQKRSSNSISKG